MSFLLKLFSSRNKKADITICGLDGAGKTTILKYLETGTFQETSPTMGINHDNISLPKLELNIFDLAGQEDFRGIWKNVNEKSDGIVFVIDRANEMRFEEARNVFRTVIDHQLGDDVTVLILLNKSDKSELIDKSEFIKEFGLIELKYTWGIFETSAKNGQNIFESFKWFVNKLQG